MTMKKTILHIGMLAAAALAFFSCVKETESPYKGRTHSVTVTVEKMLDSKTAIVEGTTEASYVWTEDDANYFHIYENGVEPLTKTMSLSQDHKYATFILTFGENNSSSYEYTARYFSEEANTKNPKILAAQSPKLDSFDPAADLLIASPKTLSDRASNIQFSLSRVVSVNKMTLKELEAGEIIKSVEIGSDKSFVGSYIIFNNNQPVDGHHHLDAGKITLTYPAAVNAVVPSNGEFPVFFTCGPVEGAKLSVRVVTDKNVYERNDFNSTVDFQVGVVKRFGVKLGSYGTPVVNGTPYVLVENQADLIDGATYIIVGNNTSLVAMAGQNNNNRGKVDVTAENNTIIIDNTIEAATFTIEDIGSGYSIKDNSTNNYLYAAGGSNNNYLRSKDSIDETATWSITVDSGVASIVTSGATRGTMCYNSSSSIFSCYANLGSYKTLSLYVDQSSIVPDTRTPVTLSFSPANPADLTLGDTFSEPTLTVDPSEAPIAYTVETVPANIATINASTGKLNITAAGTITVTATVSDVTNYQPASASYSFTVVDPNVVDYVTLPWAYPEGDASATSAGIQAITGVTAEGLGSDYSSSYAPYLIKLDGTGDYFQIKTDGAIGQVSVKYKMIGGNNTSTLTFSESSDGNTFTEVQSLSISGSQNSTGVLTTSNAFDSASRYVKIVFTKGSNVGIGGISISDAASASITWNLESIAITTPPNKTEYTAGESFDPAGMVVKGHFVDDADNTNTKDEEVTGYTISPDGALSVSDTQVTITYQGKSATQNITVNAVQVTTIADVLAGGAGTYDLNNLLVYAVNGKNAIVGDATGKMLLFMTNSLNVGDNINIASATTTVYQTTTLEITSGTITTNSSGNTIDHGTATDLNNASVATSTQTAFSASGFHSAVFVSMTGAQSGQNITGANTKLHLNVANSATDGKTVMVTGYIYSWSSSYNNYNFQAVTIAEDNTTPTLSVAPASLSWSASEYGSSNAKTVEVTLNGAAAAGDYTISGSNSDWTVSKNGNTITIYPNAENSSTTEAKSITLTIAHASSSSVSQDVTCTQAKSGSVSATYTLTFPDDNSSSNGLTSNQYQSTWTATSGSTSWTITNFNNNNWQNSWSYIKCGRKNNASVATITTSSALPEAIKTVTITIDALTASKIKSIKLYSSSNGSSWTSEGTFTAATGDKSVTISSPTTNRYYKLEFDCASGSSNGLLTLSKVVYTTN